MKRRTVLSTLLAATLICASAAFAAETTPIKGNPKSKICHKSTCKHYNAKGSTVSFKTEAETQQAGYTMCKRCSKGKDPKAEKPAKTAKTPEK